VFDLNTRSVSVSKLSRIENKGISAMLMMTTVIAEALMWSILPVSSQESW
jgi:hypothetical protein